MAPDTVEVEVREPEEEWAENNLTLSMRLGFSPRPHIYMGIFVTIL